MIKGLDEIGSALTGFARPRHSVRPARNIPVTSKGIRTDFRPTFWAVTYVALVRTGSKGSYFRFIPRVLPALYRFRDIRGMEG
jgi:hypothetical protein